MVHGTWYRYMVQYMVHGTWWYMVHGTWYRVQSKDRGDRVQGVGVRAHQQRA